MNNIKYDQYISNGPFGDSDASRSSSIIDVESGGGSEGYVKIPNSGDFGLNDPNSRNRVIVGKKGSGKTLYLRRFHKNLRESIENKSIFSEYFVVENLVQSRPQTETIVKFSQFFTGEFLTEKWRELWKRAIMRTIFTYIQFHPEFKVLKEKLPKDFSKQYKKYLSESKRPITIFSQVIEIVENTNSNKEFNKFINSIVWAELDSILAEIIGDAKPIYFYVDAIDEEYTHAPMYWMRAQKGLFYCVMQLLRDPRFGGRLHIHISIRDHVYSSILQSEHMTRYAADRTYITILRWDANMTKYLLEEKLKYLDDRYFIKSGPKTIENWVGFKEIINGNRNVTEEISNYIIRHTRLIPRDIIVIGNIISSLIEVFKRDQRKDIRTFEGELKKIIKHTSILFAIEQVKIVSNHLTSNLMPSDAIKYGIDKMFTSRYTGDQEFLNLSNIFKNKVIAVIKHIGKDKFNIDELKNAKEFAKQEFDYNDDMNLFNILWQNNLLGYLLDETSVVFFDEHSPQFDLPLYKEEFIFHSILIDLCDLKPIGKPLNFENNLF